MDSLTEKLTTALAEQVQSLLERYGAGSTFTNALTAEGGDPASVDFWLTDTCIVVDGLTGPVIEIQVRAV